MRIDLHGIHISETAFPRRVLTAFRRANISTLGELDRMADHELIGLHGIGETTVAMIRATIGKLRHVGMSRMEPA